MILEHKNGEVAHFKNTHGIVKNIFTFIYLNLE